MLTATDFFETLTVVSLSGLRKCPLTVPSDVPSLSDYW